MLLKKIRKINITVLERLFSYIVLSFVVFGFFSPEFLINGYCIFFLKAYEALLWVSFIVGSMFSFVFYELI